MSKIGLLGGSFNPLHFGHIAIAEQVLIRLNLNQIWFLPSARHPQKESNDYIPFKDRLAILKDALADYKDFVVSDYDDQEGLSYTYNLITEIQKDYPEHEFYFIIGEDNVSQLKTWYRYKDLLNIVRFVVVSRNTDKSDWAKLDYLYQLIYVPITPIEISSTDIREMLKEGRNIDDFVPLSVVQYYNKKAP